MNNSEKPPQIDKLSEPVSVWRDFLTDDYYALPDSLLLSPGKVTIRNCLTSALEEADKERLEPYLISEETALEYLAQAIENTSEAVTDYISNMMAIKIQEIQTPHFKSLNSTLRQADWTMIMCQCLDLTPSQIKTRPELFEKRLYSLLMSLINGFGEHERVSPRDRAEAITSAVKIQNILSSHKIDVGNAVVQFVSDFFHLNLIETTGSPEAALEELKSQISLLKGAKAAERSLSTMMKTIIDKYQELESEKTETDSVDTEAEVQQAARKVFIEAVAENPLPSFSFDDLLS